MPAAGWFQGFSDNIHQKRGIPGQAKKGNDGSLGNGAVIVDKNVCGSR